MIYAGNIKAAATHLADLVDTIGDIEQAGRWDLAQIDKASRALVAGLDSGIKELDPQLGGSIATAGTDPQQAATELKAQLANLVQMEALLSLRGYAGRVLINVEQAG